MSQLTVSEELKFNTNIFFICFVLCACCTVEKLSELLF